MTLGKAAQDAAEILQRVEGLQINRWAEPVIADDRTLLKVLHGDRSTRIKHSVATGESMGSNGFLGVDLIHVTAGHGFTPHTHPGDHILIVVAGYGTITFDGKIYPTQAGDVYMIDGKIPHAVGGRTDHAILAVGAPHMPVDSLERMTPVEYENIEAGADGLECLICRTSAVSGFYLHEAGCEHCPCAECLPVIREPDCDHCVA